MTGTLMADAATIAEAFEPWEDVTRSDFRALRDDYPDMEDIAAEWFIEAVVENREYYSLYDAHIEALLRRSAGDYWDIYTDTWLVRQFNRRDGYTLKYRFNHGNQSVYVGDSGRLIAEAGGSQYYAVAIRVAIYD